MGVIVQDKGVPGRYPSHYLPAGIRVIISRPVSESLFPGRYLSHYLPAGIRVNYSGRYAIHYLPAGIRVIISSPCRIDSRPVSESFIPVRAEIG